MEFSQFDLNLDLTFPRGISPERTAGVHLTQIIRSIHEETTEPKEGWDSRSLWLSGEIGFMWEEILSYALKSRLPNRIGEVEKDGIIMSPDGIDLDMWELWEYKATWKSSKNQPYDNWKWMVQVKAYALALEVCVVKMAVLYVMGDYRGSGPQYIGYRLEFTEYELRENWDLLKSHARRKGWIA